MIPRISYLHLVGLILAVLAVTGCAAVTPDTPASAPTTIAESNAGSDLTPIVTSEAPTTSPTPPEEVETPAAVATANDLPDPTATPKLSPTATPPPVPTATPTTQPRAAVVANDYGAAPEINTEVWLNTNQPLRLKDLVGQVVLVDFWTYG